MPGELTSVLDAAEARLLDRFPDEIFQRGGLLVRVCRLPSLRISRRGLSRKAKSLVIQMLDALYLRERLTASAHWKCFNSRSNSWKPADFPEKLARHLLSRAGHWSFPSLAGVIEAPTLRPDGTILAEPGYDPETGLYFDSGGVKFPEIANRPSATDLKAAIDLLCDWIAEFPFVAESDRSAAIAMFMTALLRRSMSTAPIFAIRATKRGTGKTLLADQAALIATGRHVPVMNQPRDDEEERKLIFSILIEGGSISCIDNIERPLGSETLCAVVTQETYKGRILGKSETATLPTNTTWIATGNNIVFKGDITRRVVPCDMEADCERPEERHFKRDLHRELRERRGELVAACLTIARAYFVANRPDQGLSPFGGFEHWSDDMVRSAIVWAGLEDPCKGRERLEEHDPVAEDLKGVLHGWNDRFGSDPVTAADVARQCQNLEDPFSDLLRELAAGIRPGQISARRLGKWLARHKGRIENGLRVVEQGRKQRSILWRVVSV